MKRIRNNLVLLLLVLAGIYSCGDLDKYSEIPAIKYLDHIAKDSLDGLGNASRYVELKFSVLDGDGDFGLNEEDTIAPYDSLYYFNFFSQIYGANQGSFEPIDMANPNFRIKYIDIEDTKAYKADIYIEFYYQPISILPQDTIRYDFYVVDRALNHSNTVTTPDIVFE